MAVSNLYIMHIQNDGPGSLSAQFVSYLDCILRTAYLRPLSGPSAPTLAALGESLQLLGRIGRQALGRP